MTTIQQDHKLVIKENQKQQQQQKHTRKYPKTTILQNSWVKKEIKSQVTNHLERTVRAYKLKPEESSQSVLQR